MERWMDLSKLAEHQVRFQPVGENPSHGTNDDDNNDNDDDEDPFECQSIAYPTTHAIVEMVLDESIQLWQELDDRKVARDKYEDLKRKHGERQQEEVEEEEDGDDGDTEENAPMDGQSTKPSNLKKTAARKRPKIHKGGWRFSDNRLQLPEQFDYATRRSTPPEDDGSGDRVISLLDPTKTLSYHQELWKLFESVPTAEQLEQEAKEGIHLPNTEKVLAEIAEATQKNGRADIHSISRLRMSDRHGLPPPASKSNNRYESRNNHVSTIRFEFWRRQLKRGVAPDCNRMVLEYLDSQSLLDVHNHLVELSEDYLWTNNVDEVASGFFFIEEVFYTVGCVDYVGPILNWIDGPTGRPNPARRRYLGISSLEALEVKSMQDMPLSKLELRLGMRYVHVHHGDVECAMFVTDIRRTRHANVPYPLIHDIWTPSYPTPICEACKQLVAVFVTSQIVEGKSEVYIITGAG